MVTSVNLVRVITEHSQHWVDINSGTIYNPVDIPWENAWHGLCERFGRPVIKKRLNDGFPPLVWVARAKPKPFRYDKEIKVKFTDADKKVAVWDFSPYELEEILRGLEAGQTPREIAVRVGALLEAVEKVIEKIGGDVDATIKRDQATRKRAPTRARAARSR